MAVNIGAESVNRFLRLKFERWFNGRIVNYDDRMGRWMHQVWFEDGDSEWLDLNKIMALGGMQWIGSVPLHRFEGYKLHDCLIEYSECRQQPDGSLDDVAELGRIIGYDVRNGSFLLQRIQEPMRHIVDINLYNQSGRLKFIHDSMVEGPAP